MVNLSFDVSLNDGVFVSNDPVNFVDPWGLKTYGIDFSGTAGAGGGATWGKTYVIDSKGNYGVVDHGGGGGLGGAGAVGAVQAQYTNAGTIHDLAGSSSSVGGSVGPVVQGTAEKIFAKNYTGFNAGIAGGPGLPVEFHGFIEYGSVQYKGNIWNDLRKFFKWLQSDDCP